MLLKQACVCFSLTSMKYGGSAVGRHSCLGFAFWQAKQQTSATFVQDQKRTERNKQNREVCLHDMFANSANNWELAKL